LRRNSQRPVSYEEGAAVAQKISAYKYFECSAKTGEGVRDVFQEATRAALMVNKKKKKKDKFTNNFIQKQIRINVIK
jgi:Ras family protein A